MLNVNYETIISSIEDNDIEKTNTYGIIALTYGNDEQISNIEIVKDISINKNYVDNIVSLLINNDVSILHFRDIINDMIGVL